MPTPPGGEQAGWLALGVAVIAATAQLVDRLLSRWRPRPKPTLADDRKELADEWREYRLAIETQLESCRSESVALRADNVLLSERQLELRGRVARQQVQIDTMRGLIRDLQKPPKPG